MKRPWFLALLLLTGCRDVRVQTLVQGTTPVMGGNEVIVVRDARTLDDVRIRAPVHYRSEFALALLMGPHQRSGYKQIIESIRANRSGVRIVAFESPPANGGEPSPRYRTFTLWIVPHSVYRRGLSVAVVTPSNTPIAFTSLP